MVESVRVCLGSHSFLAYRDPARFWARLNKGVWEPETLAVLDTVVRPGDRVVDVGAWIGPVTLACVAAGAKVVAYEPDPVARAKLNRNIDLNGYASDVTVRPVALGPESCSARMTSTRFGNSMTSLVRPSSLRGESRPEITVAVSAVADEVQQYDLGTAKLVKVDIEGAEFDVVPALLAAVGNTPRFEMLLSIHVYPSRELACAMIPRILASAPRGHGLWNRVVVPFLWRAQLARRYRAIQGWLKLFQQSFISRGQWEPMSHAGWLGLFLRPHNFELWLRPTRGRMKSMSRARPFFRV